MPERGVTMGIPMDTERSRTVARSPFGGRVVLDTEGLCNLAAFCVVHSEESPDFTGQDARKGRREATESATENIPPVIWPLPCHRQG